jgi:hypothetical protein
MPRIPGLSKLFGRLRGKAPAVSPTEARANAPALGPEVVSGAVTGAATGGFIGGLPGLLAGSVIGGVAGSLPFMFMDGQPSEEEQERMLRRQLEIQAEFEQGQQGGGGEMMDPRLVGLVQGEPRGMTGLLMDEDFTRQMAEVSKEMGKLQRTRPRGSSELEGIIAGNEAAIAQIQNERVLSPMEIIQMLESMNG